MIFTEVRFPWSDQAGPLTSATNTSSINQKMGGRGSSTVKWETADWTKCRIQWGVQYSSRFSRIVLLPVALRNCSQEAITRRALETKGFPTEKTLMKSTLLCHWGLTTSMWSCSRRKPYLLWSTKNKRQTQTLVHMMTRPCYSTFLKLRLRTKRLERIL